MDPHHPKPTRRMRTLGYTHTQLANRDTSGGRGVQREHADESAAISTPTSKATTSAVAEQNRLFNFGFRRSLTKRSKSASSVPKTKKKRLSQL